MVKGQEFERSFCRQLSLWFTEGRRDDVFWRTSGSGARATVRAGKGKGTAGQYGDITATHLSGLPLLDLLTFELKRGYSRCTIHDLLDKPPTGAAQEYEKWFRQASASHAAAGSFAWVVVAQRDRRLPLAFFPGHLLKVLKEEGVGLAEGAAGSFTFPTDEDWAEVSVVGLADFFKYVPPAVIRGLEGRV